MSPRGMMDPQRLPSIVSASGGIFSCRLAQEFMRGQSVAHLVTFVAQSLQSESQVLASRSHYSHQPPASILLKTPGLSPQPFHVNTQQFHTELHTSDLE